MASTFLQLAANQGGQRFGPYQGSIQIGAHPAQCQLVLSQQHGIAPIHASLIDMGNGQYTLQPAQRGIQLYLIPSGQRQLYPVQAPVAAKPGDAIVLGSQQGPTFTIHREEGRPGVASGGGFGGAGSGLGNNRMVQGIGRELQRQGLARLMHRNPAFRDAYNAWFRWRTGSLRNPRYLLAGLAGVVGLLGMALTSCSGLAFAAWQMLTG